MIYFECSTFICHCRWICVGEAHLRGGNIYLCCTRATGGNNVQLQGTLLVKVKLISLLAWLQILTYKYFLKSSLQSDVYSLGVILFEMFHPFQTEMEKFHHMDLLRKDIELDKEFSQEWPLHVSW